mgnify:CR=1 FL=1
MDLSAFESMIGEHSNFWDEVPVRREMAAAASTPTTPSSTTATTSTTEVDDSDVVEDDTTNRSNTQMTSTTSSTVGKTKKSTQQHSIHIDADDSTLFIDSQPSDSSLLDGDDVDADEPGDVNQQDNSALGRLRALEEELGLRLKPGATDIDDDDEEEEEEEKEETESDEEVNAATPVHTNTHDTTQALPMATLDLSPIRANDRPKDTVDDTDAPALPPQNVLNAESVAEDTTRDSNNAEPDISPISDSTLDFDDLNAELAALGVEVDMDSPNPQQTNDDAVQSSANGDGNNPTSSNTHEDDEDDDDFEDLENFLANLNE